MRKIHFVSGLIITAFIGLHLFNHICSVFGPSHHVVVMNQLRLFYRNPFVESVLLLAVLIQIISGLRLFKTKIKVVNTNFEKLHIWTGLYLAIFFVIHLSAVYATRYLLHLDTNFYFGVAGLNTAPFNLFFVPYYGLGILSFFGHLASIHSKKMTINFIGLTPHQQAKMIILFGLVLTIVIFYGLTNHFNGLEIPKEYNILIGK